MDDYLVTKEERQEWRKKGGLSENDVRLLNTLDAVEAERHELAWALGHHNPPCVDENWHCPTETPGCNNVKSAKRMCLCWLQWAEDQRLRGIVMD
jgi:hypothetical protein